MKTDKKMIIVPDFMVVLKEIKKGYEAMADIHYKTNITYSHISHLVNEMIEKEWVKAEKQGRNKVLSLTPKGEKIENAITHLFNTMDISEKELIKYRIKTKKRKNITEEEVQNRYGIKSDESNVENSQRTEPSSEDQNRRIEPDTSSDGKNVWVEDTSEVEAETKKAILEDIDTDVFKEDFEEEETGEEEEDDNGGDKRITY